MLLPELSKINLAQRRKLMGRNTRGGGSKNSTPLLRINHEKAKRQHRCPGTTYCVSYPHHNGFGRFWPNWFGSAPDQLLKVHTKKQLHEEGPPKGRARCLWLSNIPYSSIPNVDLDSENGDSFRVFCKTSGRVHTVYEDEGTHNSINQ